MAKINLPYSTEHMELEVAPERLAGILDSRADEYIEKNKLPSQEEIVKNALENPISSDKLRNQVKNSKKLLLITSDHTRPVPSKITMPLLLDEIRRLNPDIEVKILIATGFHRPSTQEEMIDKYGKDIVEKEDITNHDSRDADSSVFKGIMPSGGELWINKLTDWADTVVSEGFIEPHFFAGFSGGRKSILPGCADEKTVLANHSSEFVASDEARAGKLDNNPIHKDMVFAAKAANLKFILNVVLDKDKKIIHAVAGDPFEAHKKGCDFVGDLARVNGQKTDIVVTSNGGYPLDQNIYQAVKGMTSAEACVKEGGVIIMVSACEDGHGGKDFYNWFADAKNPKEVQDKILSISRKDTLPDQWEAQMLARILVKANVIMVTDKCDPKIITDMHMQHASTMKEALAMADKIVGKDSKILVIPDGISVIVNDPKKEISKENHIKNKKSKLFLQKLSKPQKTNMHISKNGPKRDFTI